MRVKNKYDYDYLALNIKASVVKRFRVFAKKIANSQSEALNIMIDFFEWHGFAPSNRMTKSILQEILKNRERTETSIKRNEATIAIIRNIEVNQTKPNNAMLLSLFGEKIKDGKPIRVEKKFAKDSPEEEKEKMDITVPKIRYERLTDKMKMVTKDFKYVLENVSTIKNNFGKDYLKLEISKDELKKFIRTLKNLE